MEAFREQLLLAISTAIDRLFGTFAEENPFTLILHEWRAISRDVRERAKTWREKLAFIFAPPGWTPRR